MAEPHLARRALAEGLGTGLLVTVVVGSGIMAERLSPDDTGLQLLENAWATALALPVLILLFAGVSGAHINPAVTLYERVQGRISTPDSLVYIGAQIVGGLLGCVLANLMFDLRAVNWSTQGRSGSHLWLSEIVATTGLLLVIFGLTRARRHALVPVAVGAYIGAAYFFTSSTSFANPAVTIGRTASDTFAGIDPAAAPMFVAMQLVGVAVALIVVRGVYGPSDSLVVEDTAS